MKADSRRPERKGVGGVQVEKVSEFITYIHACTYTYSHVCTYIYTSALAVSEGIWPQLVKDPPEPGFSTTLRDSRLISQRVLDPVLPDLF